jgi:hypothetical protein
VTVGAQGALDEMPSRLVPALALALSMVAACTTPMIAPRCVDAACNTECTGSGHVSGACSSNMCVCQSMHMPGPGDTVIGGSSGGVVERSSTHYRMRLSVGPDEAATGSTHGASHSAHLGLEPQTDPSAH